MYSEAKKMDCPDCGIRMNYHALKIDYTAELNDAGANDVDSDAPLIEAYTCPECGKTHARPHTLVPDAGQS